MGYLKYLALTMLIAGCGQGLNYQISNPPQVSADDTPLQGKVEFTDGTSVDLATIHEPMVVMFAEYTCIACNTEVTDMVTYLNSKPNLPKNARLISVLVGTDLSVAQRWKTKHAVAWQVGVNDDDEIFKDRCPQHETPCLITQNLNSKPPVHQRFGATDVSILEQETGPWTY